ncbi:hypothetical protein, variant [Aphanomyces invadans]|nr:hypothetical protein, variant [Aphanomyces invadans]ETW03282.1 hypothetical protein, variant [Aphanomyces invadans]|eukprot:XP_008867511.1 hypothetical protein, variant [Aphanomyces invadans]
MRHLWTSYDSVCDATWAMAQQEQQMLNAASSKQFPGMRKASRTLERTNHTTTDEAPKNTMDTIAYVRARLIAAADEVSKSRTIVTVSCICIALSIVSFLTLTSILARCNCLEYNTKKMKAIP